MNEEIETLPMTRAGRERVREKGKAPLTAVRTVGPKIYGIRTYPRRVEVYLDQKGYGLHMIAQTYGDDRVKFARDLIRILADQDATAPSESQP
jgi:hypothetical protein